MHLTNYSLNKMSDDFVEDVSVPNILQPNNATKRTLASLYNEILHTTNEPSVVEQIRESIHKTCSSTLAVMSNMLILHSNRESPTLPAKNPIVGLPFQIFGFDILIDEKLKAWLIEINDHPSLNTYLCKAYMGCNHKDCAVSPVDAYVKKQVVSDAITLVMKARKMGVENIEDRFNNLRRVFPCRDSADVEIFESVRELRHFFLLLTKGKENMTGSDFEQNLLKSSHVTFECGFKRIDLTLVFQKVTGRERSVDFFGFLKLMNHLKTRCETALQSSEGNLCQFIHKLDVK